MLISSICFFFFLIHKKLSKLAFVELISLVKFSFCKFTFLVCFSYLLNSDLTLVWAFGGTKLMVVQLGSYVQQLLSGLDSS